MFDFCAGDLVIEDEDWHSGLNALREDLEEASKSNAEAHQKGLENLRSDFEKELSRPFKMSFVIP
jgi:hypothetical protein